MKDVPCGGACSLKASNTGVKLLVAILNITMRGYCSLGSVYLVEVFGREIADAFGTGGNRATCCPFKKPGAATISLSVLVSSNHLLNLSASAGIGLLKAKR